MPTENQTTDRIDVLTVALDPDATAWRDAFVAANGKQPDALPIYEWGWFVWWSKFGTHQGRCRRKDLQAMTARLQERAANGE
jgi:hypothetical protein